MKSLEGKRILVTGGSRGLGLDICETLLKSKASVITTARQSTADVEDLNQRFENHFEFFSCDFSDNKQLGSFVEKAQLLNKPVHGLVANAAVGTEGVLTLLSHDQIHRSLQINLHATILITQAVLKSLLAHQQSGSLVFISSACAHRGYKGLSVYAAAKAGLCGFSKAVAREYGPRGIRSNAVLPGFLQTEMTRNLSGSQTESIRKRTSLKRLGKPCDVTQTVLHLLSDESHYITGSEIVVDGGLTN
jgi:3-oxoacyl-[acyl-carrier protein] reductase